MNKLHLHNLILVLIKIRDNLNSAIKTLRKERFSAITQPIKLTKLSILQILFFSNNAIHLCNLLICKFKPYLLSIELHYEIFSCD